MLGRSLFSDELPRCAHCGDPRDEGQKYCRRCLEWAAQHTPILRSIAAIPPCNMGHPMPKFRARLSVARQWEPLFL